MLIADVFKTVGQPTITYIERDSGKLDQALHSALNERGQLCLVTGPSKTGKTTLYRQVLSRRKEIPLVIRCDKSLKCPEIWKKALEEVDFSRAEQKTISSGTKSSAEAEGQHRFGWQWLADVSIRFKGTYTREATESEIRKLIIADPGPDLLVPILQKTNYVLVIEDFHYLDDDEKVLLFQQWKRFIDNEVSVLVLGTTHRAVDIANSNKDLIGRISQIDVLQWSHDDLEKICTSGFDHVGVSISSVLKASLSQEAVGLPIIVQQSCLQMMVDRGVETVAQAKKKRIVLTKRDAEAALHSVAKQKYTQFESYYSTLIRGPREKARKYKTYEIILGCFTLDPIKFSLKRKEIDQRMAKLIVIPSEVPPAASMNSTFGALRKFQEKRGFELLEWRPSEEILYIIEPSFLFYVRWRTLKTDQPKQLDFLELLLRTDWTDDASEIARERSFSIEYIKEFFEKARAAEA